MENSPTKIWQVILGIIILVVIGVVISATPRQSEPELVQEDNSNVLENPGIDATQLCYIWNTEAGDEAKLSIDVRGTVVIGEFYWLPAEKDQKTGIFEGTISGPTNNRTISAFWKAYGEGAMNTEELIIKLDDTTAKVGFGEMIEGPSDGIWRYRYPEALSFAPTLQQTDCGDEAMD